MIKLFMLGFFALLALPAFVPDDVRMQTRPVAAIANDGQPYADGVSVMTFAAGVASDMQGLCGRQPVVCVHGAQIVDGLMSRAKHGLKVALVMIEKRRDESAEKSPNVSTM